MLVSWVVVSSCPYFLWEELRSAGVSNTPPASCSYLPTSFIASAHFHVSVFAVLNVIPHTSPSAISRVNNNVHADHVVLFGVLDKADHECTWRTSSQWIDERISRVTILLRRFSKLRESPQRQNHCHHLLLTRRVFRNMIGEFVTR